MTECPVCEFQWPSGINREIKRNHCKGHGPQPAYTKEILAALHLYFCSKCRKGYKLSKKGEEKVHKCNARPPRIAEGPAKSDEYGQPGKVGENKQGWDEDLDWPQEIPLPPADSSQNGFNIPHPARMAVKGELRKGVPNHAQPKFAEIARLVFKNFADSVERGDPKGQVRALYALLRLPQQALRKPSRGGKGREGKDGLSRSMDQFLAAMEKGDMDYLSREGKDQSPRQPSFEDARRVEMAEGLCRSGLPGAIGKGSRLLREDGKIATPTAELADRMKAIFPATSTPLSRMDPPPEDAPRFIQSDGDFTELVRKTINASCGGRSGLTAAHIKPLLDYPDTMSQMNRVFTLLIDGDLPTWMHPYIVTFNLVVIVQKGKERPVCIGEWLYRCAGVAALKTILPESLVSFFLHKEENFRVLQFGTGIPNGVENLIHLVRGTLHHGDPERVMVKGDMQKAFQYIDRVKSVNITVKQYPVMHRFLYWSYSICAIAYLSDLVIWVCNGGFQGCAMAALNFDTAFQTCLIEAARNTATEEELIIGAIRDDVYIMGNPRDTASYHSNFTQSIAAYNLSHNQTKTATYCPRANFQDEASLKAALDTLKGLGGPDPATEVILVANCPVAAPGCEALAAKYAKDYKNRFPHLFDRLKTMDPQIAAQYIRHTILPLCTYLVRVMPWPVTHEAAQDFDNDVAEAWQAIMGVKDIDIQMYLPLAAGGYGFRMMQHVGPLAHYASLVQTALQVKDFDPFLQKCFELGAEAEEGDDDDEFDYFMQMGIPSLLADAWEKVNHIFEQFGCESKYFPASAKDIFKGFYDKDMLLKSFKLQKALTLAIDMHHRDGFLKVANDEQKAMLLSQSHPGSTAKLMTLPTTSQLTVPPAAFQSIVQTHTGTLTMPPLVCSCGKPLDKHGHHAMVCKRTCGRFSRHDRIVQFLKRCMKGAGMVACAEMRIVRHSSKRMDIILYDGTRVTWYDVSVVHPAAATYRSAASKEAGAASTARAAQKINKYGTYAEEEKVNFHPLIFETSGRFDDETKKLLITIAHHKANSTAHQLTAAAIRRLAAKEYRYMVQVLSIIIGHANGLMIKEVIMKASRPGYTASTLYKGFEGRYSNG